jgi:hypothetical protein
MVLTVVILDKLMVVQLVKYSTLYGNKRCITFFKKARQRSTNHILFLAFKNNLMLTSHLLLLVSLPICLLL